MRRRAHLFSPLDRGENSGYGIVLVVLHMIMTMALLHFAHHEVSSPILLGLVAPHNAHVSILWLFTGLLCIILTSALFLLALRTTLNPEVLRRG